MADRSDQITALIADDRGEIFDARGIQGAARIGCDIVKLEPSDLIKLPDSADLMFLPKRRAVGYTLDNELVTLEGQAVAAILPAGYTRTHLPAFTDRSDEPLPLFGYAAVVVYRNELHVAALYTDENHKWDPINYNTHDLHKRVARVKRDLPNNRIVDQLARCSLEWHCLTAQNLFYRRWEAGLPTSPICNANCLGCISLQPAECCPSPQSRITFKPTIEEIADVATYHLINAPDAIISFGQGCEGEPSLAADSIAAAIKIVRSKTSRGQININSNAGFSSGMKKIIDAGLDSVRVSIISARPESYAAYYRSSYKLDEVKASIQYAIANGVYVSLNLLYMPGFNDRAEEIDAWIDFLNELPINMIQLRNLNIDPDLFFDVMPKPRSAIVGTKRFIQTLKENFSGLQLGNFSHVIKR